MLKGLATSGQSLLFSPQLMLADPQIPAESPSPIPKWCWLSILTLSLLKLILISHDETQALPWDDLGYIRGASHFHWDAPYNTWSYCRQPVYHLFLAAADCLGLPTRIWIELSWIAAAIITFIALKRLGLSTISSLIAFTCILFHPWATSLFNRTMSDSLYGVFLLIFLSSLAVGITRTTRAPMLDWSRRTAIFAALAANTRVESILIYGSLAIAALCIFLLPLPEGGGRGVGAASLPLPEGGGWGEGASARKAARRRLALVRLLCLTLLPLAATLTLTHTFKYINLRQIGSYVTNDLELPGYEKLYKSLISIRPANPDLRFSVPHDVREWAYSHSPTFAQLRSILETDPIMSSYSVYCEQATGVKGEFGAWAPMAIREATWKLHPWPSARELDAFYNQAGDEISAALKAEPAAARWAPITFIPPEWGQLLRQLPISLGRCATTFFQADFIRLPDEKLDDLPRVNSVANRRIPLIAINNGKPDESSFWHTKGMVRHLDGIKRFLASLVLPFTIAAIILITIGTVTGLVRIRRRPFPTRWYILSAILLTAIAARLALLSLMDATGVPMQMRYAFPLAAPLVILAILNAETLLALRSRSTDAT